MKQKLVILVHKFDNSLMIVKTQSDLSVLLGVSISTIKRNYSTVGVYDTATYIVHVGVQIYDNGNEPKYKHDVEPPKPKLYNSIERANIPNNKLNMSYGDGFLAHSVSINPSIEETEEDEQDWRTYEKNMPMSEYDKYYSKRTLKQLEDSASYFKNHSMHMKYITKYGQLRLND